MEFVKSCSCSPITCDAGFFFDSSKGCCLPMAAKTVPSATVCTVCTQNGFQLSMVSVKLSNGDGVIAGTEQCDDKCGI